MPKENHSPSVAKRPHSIKEWEPTLTKQSFKNESNINNIMARYEKTGIVEHISAKSPQYGDFSEISDYQDNLNKVLMAEELFDSLPAKIRAEFSNDPGSFLDFVTNPENNQKMVDLGLAEPSGKPEASSKPSEKLNQEKTEVDKPDISNPE